MQNSYCSSQSVHRPTFTSDFTFTYALSVLIFSVLIFRVCFCFDLYLIGYRLRHAFLVYILHPSSIAVTGMIKQDVLFLSSVVKFFVTFGLQNNL